MRLVRILAAALMLLAAGVAAQEPEIFATLRTTTGEAHDSVIASVTSGSIALSGDRGVFTRASSMARVAIATAVFAAARAYTSTDGFETRYAQWRELQRPQRVALPKTGDEALAAQQQQLELVIKDAERSSAQLPPAAQEQLAHNIAFMRQQLAELNADPEHRASVDRAARQQARDAETDYTARDAAFTRAFPADGRRLIARRLRAFLDLSDTVDYTAPVLRHRDGTLHFVNPAFEAKPREWKMLYRAGKPAVDAARAAAQEWVNTLPD